MTDDRGVTPAVGKTLELGFGVLLVALLTTTLYGHVVPEYRTAAGSEVADRALADAASTTAGAVPPAAPAVRSERRTTLPATIRGATYEIHGDGRGLRLRHPHPGIGGRVPLALPARVVRVTGEWRSTDPFVARVAGNRTRVTVTLGGGA